jgi:hypothetical protein
MGCLLAVSMASIQVLSSELNGIPASQELG